MESTLGRYSLRGEIGRGAMSVIHRGYDPRLKREIALKTLRDEFIDDKGYRSRFLTEARAAGTLSHPAIVTIFDIGIADGTPFIAMELLEGPTLATFVERNGPLPSRMVLRIAMQLADALDYAHRRGVVHRDIKPENVSVLNDGGNVKLMDFGIARLRKERDCRSSTMVAGTPSYMSPEQLKRGRVDGRADLYALGVLLYWMLSGRRPFEHEDVNELIKLIVSGDLRPLRPINPATPDALVELVLTLLARDPADRFQTGRELFVELERIDAELAERERSWTGRRIIPIRLRWAAVMGLIVTLTVALGLGFVYQRQNEAMNSLAFDYGLTISGMLAGETAEDLLLQDYVAVQVLVDEIARTSEVVHLSVSDQRGRVVAANEPALIGELRPAFGESAVLLERDAQVVRRVDGASGQPILVFESPVLFQHHELGLLRVGLSTDALAAANKTTLSALVAVLLVTLVAVIVGSYVLGRRFAQPIELLRGALMQISRGSYETRIRARRNDEFERVFAAYNAMADSLEARSLSARSDALSPPDETIMEGTVDVTEIADSIDQTEQNVVPLLKASARGRRADV